MPRQHVNTTSLREILKQELLIGQRLVELSEAESEAIVANNISRLSKLELELSQRLEEQETLETARMVVVRDLARTLGIEAMPTLSILLPHLSPSERALLSQLRAQILETQALLDRLTARNKKLLYCVLEYVRFSLNMRTEAALPPALYETNLAAVSAPTSYLITEGQARY